MFFFSLLCGRNAAPPISHEYAQAGYAGILPAMRNYASSRRVAGRMPAYPRLMSKDAQSSITNNLSKHLNYQ